MAAQAMTLKFDQAKLVRILNKRPKAFLRKARRNFIFAAEQCTKEIKDLYYRGRKGNTGLNVITGDLLGGWWSRTIIAGNDVVTNISNRMAYGPYHEKNYKPKSEPRRCPPRTDSAGYFVGPYGGKRLFIEAIKKAIRDT